jgi:hypothetical protein
MLLNEHFDSLYMAMHDFFLQKHINFRFLTAVLIVHFFNVVETFSELNRSNRTKFGASFKSCEHYFEGYFSPIW